MKSRKARQLIALSLGALLTVSIHHTDAQTKKESPTPDSISETVELLSKINLNKHSLRGKWELTEKGLLASVPQRGCLLEIPMELSASYELKVEFTRKKGNNAVGIVLPLQTTQCLLELSGWDGYAHGISRLNKLPIKDANNSTRVQPGKLTNDKRYTLRITVKKENSKVSLSAILDQKEIISWTGKSTQLEPNLLFGTNNNKRIALAAVDQTVFHKVTLISGIAKESITSVKPIKPGDVELKNMKWTEFKGNTRIASVRGEDVLELNGQSSVAFLPGVEMANGIIECEIASPTFCGIAFRGKDVNNFEVAYFRPFNSGTEKHENTVQYASEGVPNGGWAELRKQFPGKYEAGADIKVNQWFHVKLVVKNDQVTVYVNKKEKPVLVVQKMLSGRQTGKIGIWGWGAYYRNFKYQPSTAQP